MATTTKTKAKTMKQYKADQRERLRKRGYVRFEAWVHRDNLERVQQFLRRINDAYEQEERRALHAAKNPDK